MELFALGQGLPGPSSTQLVISTAVTHGGPLGGIIAFFAWNVLFVLYLSFEYCILISLIAVSKASAHRAWVAIGHWLWAVPVIGAFNGVELYLLAQYVLEVHNWRMDTPQSIAGSAMWRATVTRLETLRTDVADSSESSAYP